MSIVTSAMEKRNSLKDKIRDTELTHKETGKRDRFISLDL